MLTPTGLSYDPGPARDYILTVLRPAGIGKRRVAELAGVTYGTVERLLHGVKGQPVRYLRPDITARILAISPAEDHAPCALVDATAARRRLQALVALGWTQKSLAERLGGYGENFGALLRRPLIRAATARAVEALYDELTCARFGMPPAPDESTPRKRADAAKARALARQRGWPPPAAWDDDTIGDPAATPADGWMPLKRRNWRSVDLVAAVEELARVEGLDRGLAAERLGTTKDAVQAAYRRTGNTRPRNKAA